MAVEVKQGRNMRRAPGSSGKTVGKKMGSSGGEIMRQRESRHEGQEEDGVH